MSRPLAQRSIEQLEAMFARNRAVRAELLLIESELRCRTTARAKVLHGRCVRQLAALTPPEWAAPPREPIDPKAAAWLRQALAKLR